MINQYLEHRATTSSMISGLEKMVPFCFVSRLRDQCHSELKEEEIFEIDSSSLGARLIFAFRQTDGFFEAAVPHDYIYGLLGLVGTRVLPPQLTPDYSKPYAMVYQEYAKFIVEHTGNLAILCRYQCDITGVPSWVPDFRSSIAHVAIREEILLSHPISFTGDGNRMILMGVELDFCEDVYFPLSRKDFKTDSILLADIKRFDNFLSKISNVKHRSKDGILEDWLDFKKKEQGLEDLSTKDIKSFYYSIIYNEEQVNGHQRPSAIREMLTLSLGCYSIFITGDGVLASLPRQDRDAQPGDVMIAVGGGSIPILLRPTIELSEYEFLGACTYSQSQIPWGSNEAALENRVLKEFVIV